MSVCSNSSVPSDYLRSQILCVRQKWVEKTECETLIQIQMLDAYCGWLTPLSLYVLILWQEIIIDRKLKF